MILKSLGIGIATAIFGLAVMVVGLVLILSAKARQMPTSFGMSQGSLSLVLGILAILFAAGFAGALFYYSLK